MLQEKHKDIAAKRRRIVPNIVSLAVFTCIMAAIAAWQKKDDSSSLVNSDKLSQEDQRPQTMTSLPDGTIVVNTTEIGKDAEGYGGPVPLKVYFKNGRVESVEPLPNNEDPSFFSAVIESGIFKAWNGKTPAEALAMNVDAVSGATYSSRGVLAAMRCALKYAEKHIDSSASATGGRQYTADVPTIAAIIVAAMAAVIPLFVRNRKYHIVQLILNAGVLGFWSGTFLCYSSMLSLLGGTLSVASIALLIMAVTAFIYPLFGRRLHYCATVCPFGSLQELAGMCCRKKIRMSARLVKALYKARICLWVVLMFLLWSETLSEWTGYELFAAFSPAAAALPVTICAAAFIVLSLIVPRPYCRFVCPTGMLFRAASWNWPRV